MNYTFSKNINSVAPSVIREILAATEGADLIAFAAGNPAPEAFPVDAIRAITEKILREGPIRALSYGATEGYKPLRMRLKDDLAPILDGRDKVIITSGGQQAIELACRVLCDPGDTVICENPSFIGAINAFKTAGAEVVGVEMDFDGMNLAALESALKTHKRAKLVYTIPNFQNPMGVTMSLQKRAALLDLAERYNVVVLEDNPYGELYFDAAPPAPIKSLDKNGCVIYCGSFSKTLSPALRVGFMAASGEIIRKAVTAKQTEDVHTNMLSQMIAHEFVTGYDYDAHLSALRRLYREKKEAMTAAIKRYMPPAVKATDPDGGLFIWLDLPSNTDAFGYCKRATARGVSAVPGLPFCTGEIRNGVRLCYSLSDIEQINRGVKILAECLNY